MKRVSIIGLLLFATIYALGQAAQEESADSRTFKGRVYLSDEIGWKIYIPDGWKITEDHEYRVREVKGEKMLEKTFGKELKLDIEKGPVDLIGFSKNPFNSFSATLYKFDKSLVEWEAYNRRVVLTVFKSLQDQGMKCDSLSGTEIINGLEFKTFTIFIYSNNGDLRLKQVSYSRLINGFDFGANIIYSNKLCEGILMEAWGTSTFTRD